MRVGERRRVYQNGERVLHTVIAKVFNGGEKTVRDLMLIYSGHRLGLNSLRSATASPQRGDRHATVALIRDSHGPFIASPLTAKNSIVVGLSASAANSAVAFAIWAEKNYLSHQRKRGDQRGQPAHCCAGAVRAS